MATRRVLRTKSIKGPELSGAQNSYPGSLDCSELDLDFPEFDETKEKRIEAAVKGSFERAGIRNTEFLVGHTHNKERNPVVLFRQKSQSTFLSL